MSRTPLAAIVAAAAQSAARRLARRLRHVLAASSGRQRRRPSSTSTSRRSLLPTGSCSSSACEATFVCSAKAWLGSRSARKRTLRARAHTELNARFSGRRTIVQSVRALCAWIVHTLRVRGLLHAVSERSIRLRCELACDSDLGGTSHRTCARLP